MVFRRQIFDFAFQTSKRTWWQTNAFAQADVDEHEIMSKNNTTHNYCVNHSTPIYAFESIIYEISDCLCVTSAKPERQLCKTEQSLNLNNSKRNEKKGEFSTSTTISQNKQLLWMVVEGEPFLFTHSFII